jgi:outer membrane receptor protein involved in Fe transport
VRPLLVVLLAASLLVPSLAVAAPTGVRTLASRGDSAAPPVDSVPLDRVVRLAVHDVTLHQALDSIERSAGLTFNYDVGRIDSVRRPISFSATRTTVARALAIILRGTGLEAQLAGLGRVVIAPIPPDENRQIIGRVVDAVTTRPIPRAEITLSGLWHHAFTTDSGTFRLDSVPPGTFTLLVRALGYSPGSRPISANTEPPPALFIALRPAENPLDRVVVTGTATPTETKALPSPITVITASDLASLGVTRLDQVFQGLVPGAISWDQGNLDYTTAITVRGASSLNGSFIKTYIDGVEVANPIFAAVDVHSIDRIEIIRGPEASTIYGSDASGGVMQIFTKKGYPSPRPVIDAEVGEGVIQNPTANTGALRQDYAASIAGGASDFGYNIGGSYHRAGPWIPYYSNSDPSVYGSAHLVHGDLQIDISGRYAERDFQYTDSPALVATGFPQFTKPENKPGVEREETYGAHLMYTPFPWWDNSLTIGSDRYLLDLTQTKPQFATPADSLLNISNAEGSKASLAYNTTFRFALSSDVRTTITLGVDHYDYTESEYDAANLSSVTGSFSANGVSITAAQIGNTGYFGQAIVGLGDALFLTGGLRAETNTTFGPAYGTSLSPRVGAAYSRAIGWLILKPRVAYGDGIRVPDPGEQSGINGASFVQLANPRLGPERQSGIDAGIDAAIGKFASINVTYYDQIAQDLIQEVALGGAPTLPIVQYQNVGKIRNTGWEFEGALTRGPVNVHGTFSVTYSTVEDLGPSYKGDLRPGDQALLVPKTSGGLYASYRPWRGGEVYGEIRYVGRWTDYDATALDAYLLGYTYVGQPTPNTRVFWESFPAFGKGNVGFHQALTKQVSVLLDIYNVTNNPAVEQNQLYATTGRTTVLRVAVHY